MFSACTVGGSSVKDRFRATLGRWYRHNHCLTELLAERKETGCQYDDERERKKLLVKLVMSNTN